MEEARTSPGCARVLVTGGRGFVGARLVKALAERHPDWTINAPPGPGEPYGLDVTDGEAVNAHVASGPPDLAIHLAAVSAVTSSVKDPRQAWHVNLGGTLNLVLALQAFAPDSRLLHVSSAEVYGESFNALEPLGENAQMRPTNPYAASKAAADILVAQSARSGLRSVIARPFNHTGPGQTEAFVAPSLAGQIARIESGRAEPVIYVGSLDEERDFLDVADVIDGYIKLIDGDAYGREAVFNIASGLPLKIGDILEKLLSLANLPIQVRQDPTRLRATPIRRVAGDASAIRDRFGWRPRVRIDETLSNLLEWKRREALLVEKGRPNS